MNEIVMYVVLAVLGLCLGSFAGASVWRLRARQLVEDKAAGEKVDVKEFARLESLAHVKQTKDRSRCLHCGHTLAWYDLLPLVSWLSLGGKCRYCHKRIGYFEPVMELAVAVFFVLSYALWPVDLSGWVPLLGFGAWLLAGVGLAILFAYDLRWFLLPNPIVFSVIGVAAIAAAAQLLQTADIAGALLNLLAAIFILSGLYLILYIVSKGAWVGFGDVKLGLALALLLADWRLAFLALFAANLIGCIIVIPGMITGKIKRQTHIPFGPLLILGTLVAMFFGQTILNWYFISLV
jgi:prepilin signal peptidase PulO-like enzyme (type II secretory pathway)